MKKQGFKNNKLTPLMASVLMVPLYGHAGNSSGTNEASAADTISVTGSTVDPEILRLKDAPITSTVVNKVELDKIKFTDPIELLNRIPGVSMSRNLRIPRGDKGYTIPLVDGFSLRNPYRGSTSQIGDSNSGDMERIEVIYGPGSALYGSNAFGGVINTITRTPPEEQENRIWLEAGDHDRLRSGLSSTGTVKGTRVGDVGYFLDMNRWDIGGYRDNSDDDRTTVSAKLLFTPSSESKLWIRAEREERYDKSAGSLEQAQYDADPRQNPGVSSFTDATIDSLSTSYILNTDQGEFRAGFSYRKDDGYKISSWGGPADSVLEDMNFKTQYRHDFIDANSILTGANGIAASLTVGVELIDSQNDRLEYQDETNTAIAEDENIDMTVSAPFAQLELMPTEKAKITLGLRYEDVEYDVKDNIDASRDQVRTFDAWTPKFGFSYDIDVDHKVFGGISKGFAPPSRNKMFQGTYENSNLEAELATNYELGVRGVFVDQAVTYDVAIYNLEVKDFIVDEYVETVAGRDKFRPVNAGEVNFRGLEAQLEYDPLEYLSFAVSYTYARNQFIDYVDDGNDYSGNFLSSSPKHHINARITLIPAEDFQIELEMDSISSYYTNNANDADSEGRYDRDDLFNLRVNYEQGPVELWASALNLTDEKYATRVSYSTRSGGSRSFRVGDARTLYFGAAYNF